MQYNENRKRSANSAISNAITRINACKKSTNIKIPSDFEGAGTIRAAIEMIKGVSISGIQQDFRSAINELEANESEEKARASGFNFKVGVSNLLSLSLNSSNRMSYETKKDNHDVYHQLREDVNKEHNSIFYYLYKLGTEIIDNVGKTGAKVSKFANGILANFDDSVNLSNKVKSRNNTGAEIIELNKSWINLAIKKGGGLLKTGVEKGHRIVNNVQLKINTIKENQNKANLKRKNEVFDRLNELRYSSKYSQDLINDFEKNGLDKDVKANIFGIKCKVNVNNVDKVLEQYGLENGYSNTQRLYWTMQHMNRDSGYGINQGIYRKHFWYETNDGEMIGVRKKQYEKAINEGKELTLKYDNFIKNRAKEIVKRHKVSYKEALEIIEIIDTPGGMCSIATAAESIAYQYADKPDVFEKKFGFPLYDEEKNLNDEIYIDYFMYTSSKQNMWEINHSDIMKRDSDDKVYSVNKERVVENEAGMYSLKEGNYTYTTYWPVLSANIHSGQNYVIEYLNHYQRNLTSANSLETICTKEKGDIDNIIKAINEDKSVTLQVVPKNDKEIPMHNFQGDVVDSIDGGHAVNVVSVEDNNLIICTWGGLYKIDYNELMDNSSYCLFESIDVIK